MTSRRGGVHFEYILLAASVALGAVVGHRLLTTSSTSAFDVAGMRLGCLVGGSDGCGDHQERPAAAQTLARAAVAEQVGRVRDTPGALAHTPDPTDDLIRPRPWRELPPIEVEPAPDPRPAVAPIPASNAKVNLGPNAPDPGLPWAGEPTPELMAAIAAGLVTEAFDQAVAPAIRDALAAGKTPNEIRRQLLARFLLQGPDGKYTTQAILCGANTVCTKHTYAPPNTPTMGAPEGMWLGLNGYFGTPVLYDDDSKEFIFGRQRIPTPGATPIHSPHETTEVWSVVDTVVGGELSLEDGSGVRPELHAVAEAVAYGPADPDPAFLKMRLENGTVFYEFVASE